MARAAATALSAAAVGWAVLFHGLGWTALQREAGGGCGGSNCPQGLPSVLILAFALTFGGIVAFVATGTSVAGALTGRTVRVLALTGLLAGLWPGWLGYQWLRGEHLERAWQVPKDTPDTVEGLGSWPVGDTVVRVRTDGLTAYAARDGKELWTLPAPARQSVCALSPRAERGLGVVGFAGHDKPCTTAAAVDLGTGKIRWQQPVDGAARRTTAALALSATTAVVAEQRTVRGLSAEAGQEQWKRESAQGCAPLGAEAAGGRVLMLEECRTPGAATTAATRLLSLDARTGAQLWEGALPVETPAKAFAVLSVEPAVVSFWESDPRGTAAVLSYDGQGRGRAVIPLSGKDGTLLLGTDRYVDVGRPAPLAAVVGDTLVTAVQAPGRTESAGLAGYSLADGKRVWAKSLGEKPAALTATAGARLSVLGERRLWTLDGRTGKDSAERVAIRGNGRYWHSGWSESAGLWPVEGGYVVVNSGSTSEHPLYGLRR
ncbi:PQQ-binding-like beta-propeller repeat protein [Streptomyces sp. NBC_00249]|uniref:outer membrane protein assembly factor BamB family protein n=1 Tax=Streptomyces sp. NBC_00249 TaxID=2975690 RepID=UPI0022537A4B|nr:PQQ-binding-like beta-propeller repeat protein [Streptomyces sp. NBC_00249]MCX5198058.1 PQQ-binding-like beta-propeller repeat protein [Streptomyces sp. NBC_00249]